MPDFAGSGQSDRLALNQDDYGQSVADVSLNGLFMHIRILGTVRYMTEFSCDLV